ncbi:hypothetical protein [Desulfopila aestuarii]|uniref:Uncharacterized protein n=1 Tax=Desulfopila aestuarii DSM 18488 TaxID=1121416 RepID=A0A1M7YMT8_9BACT|nr:hypothetical protein [Desulfopila aestuarii]SHO53920.1 hypothetical protein SAMN02745220_05363 [Desulfopila aestuarii DSM 18488]
MVPNSCKNTSQYHSMFGRVLVGILVCLMMVGFSNIGMTQDSADSLLAISGINQQEPDGKNANLKESFVDNPIEKADELTHIFNMTQERYKLYECILLAGFALISLIIIMRSLCNKENCSAAYMVNASGLIFIIFGTLFLVLLADVDEQLNAGVGILGAVAGYLFGTMRKGEPERRGVESE